MAGFHTKTFSQHDEYMTPKYAWENIKDYIPSGKVIWEAFYGDAKSAEYLRELGHEVIHENIDFFEHDKGEIVVSNPPFTLKKEVFTRLKELGKPFIIICPSAMIHTQYIRKLFSDCPDKLQIIIPRKRIQFEKLVDGEKLQGLKNECNFDCFYYCWKIGMESDITWLS